MMRIETYVKEYYDNGPVFYVFIQDPNGRQLHKYRTKYRFEADKIERYFLKFYANFKPHLLLETPVNLKDPNIEEIK